MKVVCEIIFGLLYIAGFFLFFNGLLYWQQRRIVRTQLKDFDIDVSKYILINIQSETLGTWRDNYSPHGKAYMYFMEDFLLILPPIQKGFMSFLRSTMLTMIFTKDINKIKAKTKIVNAFVPDYIRVSENGRIEIQYKYNPLITAKDYVYIDVIEKDKFEVLSKIKEWWNS